MALILVQLRSFGLIELAGGLVIAIASVVPDKRRDDRLGGVTFDKQAN